MTVNSSKSSGRSAGRTALRIAVILVILIAGLELGMRFILGLGNPVLIQPDAYCSFILKPNQDVFRFFAHTHVNRYGMRSDEIAPSRTFNSLRLMFVGDSVTYGTSRVDQQDLFTERLHRDLPQLIHRPVEVLNASASAWAPENELAYIRSRGIFRSDIVLLVLNDGDLTQPKATIADIGDNLPQSKPAGAIAEFYTRYLRPRLTHVAARQDAGDVVAENSDQVLHANLADLDEFAKIVEIQGGRMAIVYLPFRRDIPTLSKAPEAILQTWCKQHGVALFDLTASELPSTAAEITLADGLHLNAKGNLLVAHAIEQQWPQLSNTAQ